MAGDIFDWIVQKKKKGGALAHGGASHCSDAEMFFTQGLAFARKPSTSDELFILPPPSQLCIPQQSSSQIRTLKPRCYPSDCQHNSISSYTGTSSIKLLKKLLSQPPPKQAMKPPESSELSGALGDKPHAQRTSRKLNKCHGRKHDKGDDPITRWKTTWCEQDTTMERSGGEFKGLSLRSAAQVEPGKQKKKISILQKKKPQRTCYQRFQKHQHKAGD